MELSLAISIVSIVIVVLNFFFNRKDKAVKDTKEHIDEVGDQKVTNYRLGQVELKLDKVLDILDNYEKETRRIVEEEIEKHILKYHK